MSEQLRAALLSLVYEPPAWGVSNDEQERLEHRDLPRRSRADLARERERVRLRLTLDDTPPPWLLERLRRLTEVLERAR